MIQLNPKLFSRAAQKAATVRPAIQKRGARYFVARADGGLAVVRFVPMHGALWCECSCPAGSPEARRVPLPCYHVAAVLLATIQNKQPMDESAEMLNQFAGHHDRDYWTGGAYAFAQ